MNRTHRYANLKIRIWALDEGLRAALTIGNEKQRAYALTGLALPLTGKRQEQALQGARRAILDSLLALQEQERSEILRLLGRKDFFTPATMNLPPTPSKPWPRPSSKSAMSGSVGGQDQQFTLGANFSDLTDITLKSETLPPSIPPARAMRLMSFRPLH